MDKTLNRDLLNLCWRLLVFECNTLITGLKSLTEDIIEVKEIIEIDKVEFMQINNILYSIHLFLPRLHLPSLLNMIDAQMPLSKVRDHPFYFVKEFQSCLYSIRKQLKKEIR